MVTKAVLDTFGRLNRRLRSPGRRASDERRLSKRADLRIPIQVRVGDSEPAKTRLVDISPSGMRLIGRSQVPEGERVWARFEGYPGVCENFVLIAEVVRSTSGRPPQLAARIDREATRPEALVEYRKLVLHYLRHRPLLEKKGQSFVEVRCSTCGWVGRVSVRRPVCSRCGLRVRDVIV